MGKGRGRYHYLFQDAYNGVFGYLVVWVWLTGESDWVPIVLYTSRLFACIGPIRVIWQILGIIKMDSLKVCSDKIVI